MDTKKIGRILALSLALVSIGTPAIAQDASPEPAVLEAAPSEAPGRAVENLAIVVSVKGRVMYDPGDGTRVLAKVGQVLPEGAVMFTGPRSAVQIRIGETQVFTIDRIGKVALTQMRQFSSADATTLDVDYGRVLFNVTSTEAANDVTIRAPDATLAIKGTSGGLEVTPGQPTRGFGGEFNQGRIELTFDKDGQTTNIEDDSEADSDNPDPTDQKKEDRVVETSDENSIEEEESEANERSTGSSDNTSRETSQALQDEQGDDETIIDPDDPFNPDTGIDFDPDLNPNPNDSGGDDMMGGDDMGGDDMGGDGMDMDGGDMMEPGDGDMMDGGDMMGGDDMGGGDDMMGGDDMGGEMMEDPFVTPDVFVASSDNGGELLGIGDIEVDDPVSFPVEAVTLQTLPENVGSGGLTMRELSAGGDRELIFLAGGNQAVDGTAGNDVAVNRLYSTIFTPGDEPEPWTLLPFDVQFDAGLARGFEIGSTVEPVLTDLVAFDDAAAGANQELYAVRAFLDEGGMGSNTLDSAIVRLDFDSTTVTANEVTNLLTPLEGLGGNNQLGLFAAGFLQPTSGASGNDFADLVVYQIDPRNNYVIDSWWGGNNDFDFVQGVTDLEGGFNPTVFNDFDRIGAVDVDMEGSVAVVGFREVDASTGAGIDPFLISFDVAGGGTLEELGSTGQAGSVIGVANFEQGVGVAFAPQSLAPAGTIDLDIAGINQAFAHVAYSSNALDSGALGTVFTQHFIETANDPVFCAIDSLITMIPGELLNNANVEMGIGRTAYNLRTGLPDTHPCVAPFVAQGGGALQSPQ